jgi:S1-C subfamily serine protease
VTAVDWAALVFVALMALLGLRRGLIMSALSLAGIAAGAIIGARLVPQLLSGGSRSPYTPIAALAGAVTLGLVLEGVGAAVGAVLRGGLRLGALRALDSLGGLLVGAASGLGIVWVLGVVALQTPGQTSLRERAQQSLVVRDLVEAVSPARVLRALARVDPLPAITGPLAPVGPPDPRVLKLAGVRRAAPSVVRILGTACGLGVEGSGWVVRPGLVVTAAHVVAGETDTTVAAPGSARPLDATAVAFDDRNDVAVLRVDGLRVRALRFVDALPGEAVAILGYPGNGPFDAEAGRVGRTVAVIARPSSGRGVTVRKVTTVRGLVRHGNSGGPAVDARGRVEATMFAAREGGHSGFGAPAEVVRRALAGAHGRVSTGDCAG